MKNEAHKKSIIGSASITNKSENQDSNLEFEGDNFNCLFLADGLGSFKYAKLSSSKVTEFLKETVKELDFNSKVIDSSDFLKLFELTKLKLMDFSDTVISEEEKKEQNLFGTTAITLLETEDKIYIAYVGNGAIWHIRGNFNEFPASYPFPWCAVNYLNPHTIPEHGKEALYKLFTNNSEYSECIPSIIQIDKDKHIGDIFMICSDGIYSADQLKVGKNDKGIWIKYESAMLRFFEYLTRFLKSNQGYNKESLNQALTEYLEEIKLSLDDDATIGLIVTREVLNYQLELNCLDVNESNSGK